MEPPEPTPEIPPKEREETLRLLRRVSRRSPVRPSAESLLRGEPLPTLDILPWMSILDGRPARRWRERAVAAWLLSRAPLDPQQRETVIASLLALLRAKPPMTSGWTYVGCVFHIF